MNRDSVHLPGIIAVIACFLAVLLAPSFGQATTTQPTIFGPTPKTFIASTGVQGLVDSTEPRAEKRHSRFEIFGYDRLFGQFCRYDGSRNRVFTRFHFEDCWRCWTEPPVLVATSGGRVRRIFQGTCGSSATGFDFMHARYYSPYLARFVSVDPVGGSVGSSQSWNRYSYVLNNPISLVDPDGRAPAGALTEQMIRRDMTPAQVQQFNAIQARVEPKIVAGGMAVGAAIAVATPEMAAGAGIGFVTSVASVSGSDAPAETKIKAVVAGTATGYITGPWDFSLPGGLISAVGSRAVADKVSGQPHMSGGEAAVESINGAAANFIASAIPGAGPLIQIAVAGLSKYALDQGANAALSGESQGLTKQSVPVGTNDWINQRRDELRQGD